MDESRNTNCRIVMPLDIIGNILTRVKKICAPYGCLFEDTDRLFKYILIFLGFQFIYDYRYVKPKHYSVLNSFHAS